MNEILSLGRPFLVSIFDIPPETDPPTSHRTHATCRSRSILGIRHSVRSMYRVFGHAQRLLAGNACVDRLVLMRQPGMPCPT